MAKLFALGAMSMMLPLAVSAEAVFTFDCAAESLAKGATTTCTIAGESVPPEAVSKVAIQVMKDTLDGLTIKSFAPNATVWQATKNDAINFSYEVTPVSTTSDVTGAFQVGAITVQLTDDAEECGKICVNVTYWDGDDEEFEALSGVDTSPKDAEANCEEVDVVGTPSPGTGAFANYVVLIGSAGVALTAIALSKKKMKFYRV